jgi:hypothetical protein
MLRENGAINFDFDMNDGGSAVNFWHGTRDSQISSAVPVLSINADGIALGGGSTIHRILTGKATLTFAPIAAQTCEEQTLTIQYAMPSAAVSASPAAPLGSPSLSWQAWVSGSGGVVSVRLCNVGAAGGVTPAAVVWNVSGRGVTAESKPIAEYEPDGDSTLVADGQEGALAFLGNGICKDSAHRRKHGRGHDAFPGKIQFSHFARKFAAAVQPQAEFL